MTSLEAAVLFREMAERLEANTGDTFGGAFLVVPPGDSVPVDGVFITTSPNPAVFWSSVGGQVSLAIEGMSDQGKQNRGGYR